MSGDFFIDDISCSTLKVLGSDINGSKLSVTRKGATNSNTNLFEIKDENDTPLMYVDNNFDLILKHPKSTAIDGNPSYNTNYIKHSYETLTINFAGEILTKKQPIITPSISQAASLGTATLLFYNIFAYNLYRTNTYSNSDQRIKENIIDNDSSSSLTKIMNIRLRKFNLINDPSNTVTGVIAQEVKTVLPTSINIDKGLLSDGSETNDFHYIDKDHLFIENIGATQCLKGYIDQLVSEINTLKSTVTNLQNRVTLLEQ